MDISYRIKTVSGNRIVGFLSYMGDGDDDWAGKPLPLGCALFPLAARFDVLLSSLGSSSHLQLLLSYSFHHLFNTGN